MVKKVNERIRIIKIKKDTKEKLKNVSLGTSKNNYIDPRIIVAFIKTYNIPNEKIFSSKLVERFDWAFKATKDYKF